MDLVKDDVWLFLDSNYLCWRSFHSLKFLSHNEIRTEVVYGYFKTLVDLQKIFFTQKVVHCFDGGKLKRKEIYPEYKGNRRKGTPDEEAIYLTVIQQISALQKEYLPEIGFKNIFSVKGYEADDVIASLCNNLDKDSRAVIVSSDQDLYQLLRNRIEFYNPRTKELLTKKKFIEEWGFKPIEWVLVKAMAGCASDNIDGIDGIGEKTAAKYLREELSGKSVAYKSIENNEEIWKRNLALVKLPYEGCPTFELVEDQISQKGWRSVTERLGIKSLNL